MLRIILSIFLMVQCFAHGLGRHGNYHRPSMNNKNAASSEIPNGYIDNIDKDDWSIPDSKFIFNYEQMRKDQPTQVEQRKEDLGRYMYTNPITTSTTTSTPEPSVEALNNEDKLPEVQAVFNDPIIVLASPHRHRHSHHLHHHHSKHQDVTAFPIPNLPEKQEVVPDQRPHIPTYSWNEMNYHSAYPTKMPPPPALPQWEDLNELIKHQSQHQHYAKPHISNHKDYMPTTEIPVKVTTRHSHLSHHENKRKDTQTTVLPVLSEIKSAPSLGHKRNKAQHSNRGSHKFSWDDVPQTPTGLSSSTTVASVSSQKGNPPPPVPTLSPWYDGFGK